MNRNLKNLLGLIAVVLFLSSPIIAAPGGHGGGGGHAGGGAGHSSFDHAPSFSAPQSNFNAHQVNPNSFNRSLTTPGSHPYSHPYSGGPGHFSGYAGHNYPHYGNYGHYSNWYHGDWHNHWNHPWPYGPIGWWSVGFATGAVVWDAPWYWGYWPYHNPYYTEVIVIDNATIDYSRPIVLAGPPPAQLGSPPSAEPSADEDQTALDASRDAFAKGDYPTAMTLVNQAIAKKPNDTVLHEFRSLILFATKQYKPAAAAVYAVLSVGPGWDWATLSGFYPSADVYTGQLRSLEQYRNANLNSPEVRFLLAYHYMSCGYSDAAVAELKEVVRLNPKDTLSAQLLAALSGAKPQAAPVPGQPAAVTVPVSAASLVGNWEATRSDGASFAFHLTDGATYSWKYTQKGKSQEFSGAYTVADNLLILKQGGNPTMIGQVTLLGNNRFNFKLVGNNPSDPGLTFNKK